MSSKIWIDITDPKYALFFAPLIHSLKESVLITTRGGEGYGELGEILRLLGIEAISLGGHGGANRFDKFSARLFRQRELLDLFSKVGTPSVLVTGVSVDAVQVAYALGIKIAHFFDTPYVNGAFSKVAMLSLPLCDVIFYPFVLSPWHFDMAKNSAIIEYPFIDPALYLDGLAREIYGESERSGMTRQELCELIGADSKKPLVLVREEEYKAHYVKSKSHVIYESAKKIASLDVNVVIAPRYGSVEPLGDGVIITKQALRSQDLYPHVDVLLGGGGSMNLEACYLGIPTISVRSHFLPHDLYLLEHNLMTHAGDAQSAFELCKDALDNRSELDSKRADNRALFYKGGERRESNFDFALGVILSLL